MSLTSMNPGRALVSLVASLVSLLGLAGCGSSAPPTDAGADAGLDGGQGATSDGGPPDAGPAPPSRPAADPLIQWVDPFVGTGGLGFNDIGSTFPGPARPFGMIRPGPDSASTTGGAPGFLHCAGYSARDRAIRAFSHTRMNGTGIADYGTLGVMPLPAWDPSLLTTGLFTRKVDSSEEASPGYYAVTLERGGVRAELTSAERVAFHRYTFDRAAAPAIALDAGHALATTDVEITEASLHVDAAAGEVSGFARFDGGYSGRFGGMPVYFVARAGQPIASFGTWVGRTATAGATDATGAQSGAWLTFAPSTTSVVLEVAISFVDLEGARANLAAEGAGFDFDAARAAAESAWEAELSRVRIEGRSDAAFTRFYSALYHTLLMPTLAADADGRYRGLDGEVHSASFRYHTDFSLWDTYRSLHPWLTLAYPAHQQNMLRSLIAMGTDGGMMPRWPLGIGYTGGMLGDPAAIVFADSWIKGLRDYDLRAAYTALRRSAQGEPNPLFGGRGSAEPYNRLGYVPLESGGSAAARTLEFAYADHAMAILAEALGETDDQAMFATRARSWRNTYDPARGFFVARHEDGRFRDGFREDLWVDDYAEGNAWQYLWLVPQDASGLAELLGGEAMARARLTHFFEESYRERRGLGPPRWYWHGNEPDMHACALFSAWGDPAAGSRWCAWVREAFYGEGPEGLPGNDDGGTMSAWYVFAALGLMPFAATDRYWIVAPEVTRATIAVEGGVLTIEAPGASDRTPYVTSATIDGEPLPDLSITHARLTAGATLRLEASETAR